MLKYKADLALCNFNMVFLKKKKKKRLRGNIREKKR